jgi:hypothetical protein
VKFCGATIQGLKVVPKELTDEEKVEAEASKGIPNTFKKLFNHQ